MKLRNKKTGEVVEYDSIGFRKGLSDGWEDFISKAKSLAELNENWEDYKPLIKDEKVRKAIRAWADAIGVEKVAILDDYRLASEEDEDVTMIFPSPIFEGIDNEDFIDITELCGEDE